VYVKGVEYDPETIEARSVKTAFGGAAVDVAQSIAPVAGDILIAANGSQAGWSHPPITFEDSGVIPSGSTDNMKIISNATFPTTQIDILPGRYAIVQGNTETEIAYAGLVGYAPTPQAGGFQSFLLDENEVLSAIVNASPNADEIRHHVFIGGVVFAASGLLIGVFNTKNVANEPAAQLADHMRAVGPIKTSGGSIAGIAGTYTFEKAFGKMFAFGSNYNVDNDDPHETSLSALNPVLFFYTTSAGVRGNQISVIDPDSYEDGTNTVVAVPNNKWTFQTVFQFSSGNVIISYGQTLYANDVDALLGVSQDSIRDFPGSESGIVLGYIVVKEGAANLDAATFVQGGKFRGGTGSLATGGTEAAALLTTGAPVIVNASAPPAVGDHLIADSATNAAWTSDIAATTMEVNGVDAADKLIVRDNAGDIRLTYSTLTGNLDLKAAGGTGGINLRPESNCLFTNIVRIKDDRTKVLEVETVGGTEVFIVDTVTERVRTLDLQPKANNAYDLGTSSLRWATIYSQNVLNVSDENEKKDVEDEDCGLDFIKELIPKKFNFKVPPEAKSNGVNRIKHHGFMAQDILNTRGNKLIDIDEDGVHLINYSNFISPLVKAVQELASKVNVLESQMP
jgi:hypothetical protein